MKFDLCWTLKDRHLNKNKTIVYNIIKSRKNKIHEKTNQGLCTMGIEKVWQMNR